MEYTLIKRFKVWSLLQEAVLKTIPKTISLFCRSSRVDFAWSVRGNMFSLWGPYGLTYLLDLGPSGILIA